MIQNMTDLRKDLQAVREEIRTKVLAELNEQRERAERALSDAAEATTHADAKQEGKYDTRAIESSYLASAQSERLLELTQKAQTIERMILLSVGDNPVVRLSSLIALIDENDQRIWYMILPGAGGLLIQSTIGNVTVVAPESPLGKELLGKTAGDEIELSGNRLLTIEGIY